MTVTLHDVVARRTPLDWFESVAIVQAVCAASLLTAGDVAPRIPEPEAIVLTPDGLVGFTEPGPADAAPVDRGMALLRTLLTDPDSPSGLRMLVATAVSAKHYASLNELSEALEYYERPDRRAVLAAVYERALRQPEPDAAAAVAAGSQSPAAPLTPRPADPLLPDSFPAFGENWEDEFASEAASPMAAAAPAARSWEDLAARTRARAGRSWTSALKTRVVDLVSARATARATSGPRRVLVGTAALFVVALATGGWWLWPRAAESGTAVAAATPVKESSGVATASPAPAPVSSAPPTGTALKESPAAATTAAAPAPATAPTAAPSSPSSAAVPSLLKSKEAAAAPSTSGRAKAAAFATAPPATSAPSRVAPAPMDTVPRSAFPTSASPVLQPTAPSTAPAPGVAANAGPRSQLPVDEVVYLGLEADDAPRPAPAGPVYSAADADVRPPVGIQPRFWHEPPTGIDRERLTQVEILVSAHGDVAGAKAVAGPRSYFDGMVLSAVKAWKFQPATRNGLPVAYRTRVYLKVD